MPAPGDYYGLPQDRATHWQPGVTYNGGISQSLKAISDAYGTPTFADDLAKRLRELARLDMPGIYHIVNSGAGVSYEEFTRAALKAAHCGEVEIESVRLDALQRPAQRPRNSRLRCLLSEALGLPALPDWEQALTIFAAQSFK